jgi:alanine racemase
VELSHVVKSNAYGHGLELVAREDEAAGLVHSLSVISVEELVRVREAGVKLPVLILGYVPLNAWETVVDLEGQPVIWEASSLEALSTAAAARGRQVPVHLKVETGTHRYGIPEAEVLERVRQVDRLPGLALRGLSTHYANIEDTTDHAYAGEQLERFQRILGTVEAAGFAVPRPHTACSAATILFPESQFGLVRVGISAYGIWPSKETRVSAGHLEGDPMNLRPVLTWKTRVGQVKRVPAGGFVGYGCSWRAPVDTTLAVLPIGYADGYDRQLSNVGHVLIRGQRAPIRGRICMNVCMVDVTHIREVALEDEVVLLGAQAGERISPEDLAGWAGTIAYEIVARIAPHHPRIPVSG